jgi:hypothetical protein
MERFFFSLYTHLIFYFCVGAYAVTCGVYAFTRYIQNRDIQRVAAACPAQY